MIDVYDDDEMIDCPCGQSSRPETCPTPIACLIAIAVQVRRGRWYLLGLGCPSRVPRP